MSNPDAGALYESWKGWHGEPQQLAERCVCCDELTGSDGQTDDTMSLYDGDDGPYCETCWECRAEPEDDDGRRLNLPAQQARDEDRRDGIAP